MPTFIQTFTGREIDLEKFSRNDVVHFDIAIPLSRIARFNGHTVDFYSVAEHCLLAWFVSQKEGCDVATQLAALLHDAHEAYTGDLISPLKKHAAGLCDLDAKIQSEIERFYGVEGHDRAAVKLIDVACLHAERRDLMAAIDGCGAWGQAPPMTDRIPRLSQPLEPKAAGYSFLQTLKATKERLDARPNTRPK